MLQFLTLNRWPVSTFDIHFQLNVNYVRTLFLLRLFGILFAKHSADFVIVITVSDITSFYAVEEMTLHYGIFELITLCWYSMLQYNVTCCCLLYFPKFCSFLFVQTVAFVNSAFIVIYIWENTLSYLLQVSKAPQIQRLCLYH